MREERNQSSDRYPKHSSEQPLHISHPINTSSISISIPIPPKKGKLGTKYKSLSLSKAVRTTPRVLCEKRTVQQTGNNSTSESALSLVSPRKTLFSRETNRTEQNRSGKFGTFFFPLMAVSEKLTTKLALEVLSCS